MKVRMLAEISGNHKKYEIGEVCELADDEATRWISAGFAEPFTASRPKPTPEPDEPSEPDDPLEPGAVSATAPEAATLADADERATLPRAVKR